MSSAYEVTHNAIHKVSDFFEYNPNVATGQKLVIINNNIEKCKQQHATMMMLSGLNLEKIFIFSNGKYFCFKQLINTAQFDKLLPRSISLVAALLTKNDNVIECVNSLLNLQFNFPTEEQEKQLELYNYCAISEEESDYYYKGIDFVKIKLSEIADVIENDVAEVNDIIPIEIGIIARVNKEKKYPLLIRVRNNDNAHLISLIYLTLVVEKDFKDNYSSIMNKDSLLNLELEYEKEGMQKRRYELFYHEKNYIHCMKELHKETAFKYYNFH